MFNLTEPDLLNRSCQTLHYWPVHTDERNFQTASETNQTTAVRKKALHACLMSDRLGNSQLFCAAADGCSPCGVVYCKLTSNVMLARLGSLRCQAAGASSDISARGEQRRLAARWLSMKGRPCWAAAWALAVPCGSPSTLHLVLQAA